ncbi:MAG TPA: uroporphyrinogen-III synthase [Trichococcus sp.]|nr:uroporphyrinogen-III synthase [Trichococcus sp.]
MTKAKLLTRPLDMNAENQIRFRAQGLGRFYEIPLCEIKPLPITEEAIKRKINAVEWLFFTSQAPVASVLAVIEKGHPPLIAVIGKKTGKMVQSCGFKVAFVSPDERKAELVELLNWEIYPLFTLPALRHGKDSFRSTTKPKKYRSFSTRVVIRQKNPSMTAAIRLF